MKVLFQATAVALVSMGAMAGPDGGQDKAAAVADREYVRGVVSKFVKLKRKQMNDAARAESFKVHHRFDTLFYAMAENDVVTVTNEYAWIRARIGQYERRPGGPDPDPALNTPAWQYVLPSFGAWGELHRWPPRLARRYAGDILGSMPKGAVFFGGTDSGRFVVTAFNDMVATNKVIVITQNALADFSYMSYIRRLYGGRVDLPEKADSARAFQKYVEDVKSGKRPENAEIKIKDGRVTVSGVKGVMEINGILAQMIFERNRDRPFFIEESYVIRWMYPYLTPHGLILKLNREHTPLTDEMVKADHEFWAKQEKELWACADFRTNTTARSAYVKLRCAIGGVYASRDRPADAEKTFEQARRLLPEAPEPNCRLAEEVFLKQHRYAEARGVVLKLKKSLPRWLEMEKEFDPTGDPDRARKRIDELLEKIAEQERAHRERGQPGVKPEKK